VYSASLQKFSLNSAVDYLENYNLNGIESEEQKLYDILTNSCYSPHWVVKHAAITGIGSFAASLGDNFIPYTKETFDVSNLINIRFFMIFKTREKVKMRSRFAC